VRTPSLTAAIQSSTRQGRSAMKSKTGSRMLWLLICALLLSLIFPIAASGHWRWNRGRARDRAVVVYRYHPRTYATYAIYGTRSYYYRPRVVYAQPYYARPYYVRPYSGGPYYGRPYYDRYYQSYGYWYAPIHGRHHRGFRVNLRW
jgi:hypothetical protein